MNFLKNNQSGSAMMTALGIIGLIGLSISTIVRSIDQRRKILGITKIQTGMIALHNKLEQAGSNINFYKFTTTGLKEKASAQHLINCFNPDINKRICVDMAADEWKEFTAKYVVFKNKAATSWTNYNLSGVFDSNGKLCNKAHCLNPSGHAFKAKTWYRLDCSNDNESCKSPALIHLKWTITHGDKKLTGGVQIPEIKGEVFSSPKICPEGTYLKGMTASNTLDCRPLSTNRAQMCPPKEYVWKVTANGSVKCRKKENLCKDLCLALILDTSGSMRKDMRAMKNYANKFVDRFGINTSGSPVNDQIAVVSFGTRSTTSQILTSNIDQVKGAINGLVAKGMTNFQAGLNNAANELAKCSADSVPVAVFMSDGRNNRGQRPPSPKKLRNMPNGTDPGLGVKFFSIAMGPNADRYTLKKLSGKEKDNFFKGASVASLDDIFTNISKRICRN